LDVVLTPSLIDNAFVKIGAKSDALDLKKSIMPIARAYSSKHGISQLIRDSDNVLEEEKAHYSPTLVSLIKLLGDLAVQ